MLNEPHAGASGQASLLKRSRFLALWLLMAGLLFWNTWSGSQFPSDDCIYAVIGRECLDEGHWLDPTWQDVPFLDKGPMLPWMLAVSISVFGESELALRLPGVLAGLLLLAGLYRLGRRLGLDPTGGMLAVFLAIALNVLFMTARRPMTDVPATALGLAGFLLSAFPGEGRKGDRRAAVGGVLLGLSLLTKLTAPVPYLFALLALQVTRDFRRPRSLGLTLGFATLTAIPWHAYMIASHGRDFLDTYLLFHVVERAARPVVGTAAAQTYLDWMVGREGLAALLVSLSLPYTAILAIRKNSAALCVVLLGVGAAAPLLVSATALPHYLVACVPPFALSLGLAADRLVSIRPGYPARWLPVTLGGLLAVAFAWNNGQEITHPDHGPGTKAACAVLESEESATQLRATFDLHDPCATWYCNSRVGFYGANPGYLDAIRGIPMLQGFVHAIDSADLRSFAGNGTLVLTRKDRFAAFQELAEAAGVRLHRRTFHNRVVVELLSGE